MDFSMTNPLTSNGVNLAARADDAEALRALLGRGRNPNVADFRGWTALHEAAAAGAARALRQLLRRTELLARTHEGHTALHLAVVRAPGAAAAVVARLLLRRGPRLRDELTPEGVSPLHFAAARGRVDLVQMLIEAGAPLQPRDADGDSPLHLAARSGRAEAIAVLLHAGAEADARNDFGLTPFLLACYQDSLECAAVLFPFVVDVNDCADDGNTALFLAVQGGSLPVVEFLLANGADPAILNDEGISPLRAALTFNRPDLFRRLLPATAATAIERNVFARACRPLYFATEVVVALLESDLAPEFFNASEPFRRNVETVFGLRPRYETAAPLCSLLNFAEYLSSSSEDLFETLFALLLTKGVAVDSLGAAECPPLVYLHYCDHARCYSRVIRVLVDHGCDVDYCSAPPTGEIGVPDAIVAAVAGDGLTLPTLLRCSLRVDPEHVVRKLVEHDMSQRISPKVLAKILPMCFLSAQTLEKIRQSLTPRAGRASESRSAAFVDILKPSVPSLKHFCRKTIRSRLRLRISSTREFFNVLREILLPHTLKLYLRFC